MFFSSNKKIINYFYKIIEIWSLTAGFILLIIVLCTAFNSLIHIMNSMDWINLNGKFYIIGYEDILRLLLSCAALMFLPYCQLKKGNIKITFFSSFLNNKIKSYLDKISDFISGLISIFLFYWLIRGMSESYQDNILSRVISIVEWPFYIPGIFSMFLWSLVCFVQLFGFNKNV